MKQSFLNDHCWTIFDKLVASASAAKSINITENLFHIAQLLTSGYCSYREIILMVMSKLEESLDLPTFTTLLKLLEGTLTHLSYHSLQTGIYPNTQATHMHVYVYIIIHRCSMCRIGTSREGT